MHYISHSLNGSYEMMYTDKKYTGTVEPGADIYETAIDMKDSRFDVIPDAVPGYWEDMTARFAKAQFYRTLRINPEFGIWEYPIAEYCPDMALPNIVGNFIYRRTFDWQGEMKPSEIYFGGVQNAVSVWINGVYLGRHEGYSAPFGITIPDGVIKDGSNTVTMSVSNTPLDGYNGELVSGITNRAACECTGGIYGEVELRTYMTPLRDAAVLVSKDAQRVTVKPEVTEACTLEWSVCDGDKVILSGTSDGEFSFGTEKLEKWSPESPKLYTLYLGIGEDRLERRFGVRSLVPDGDYLRLNGKPYYLRGICEHCYYPDTVNPWQDLKKYRAVIKKLKSLGFNFIRFHTHIPMEEYLTAADELGMLIHVESPNNTTVSEWRDIVRAVRRHTSAVIYCCGNEMMMDEPFIEHLNKIADIVHGQSDGMFAPISAMRGLEYVFSGSNPETDLCKTPFIHHPKRFETVEKFSDMYSSYSLAHFSYSSTTGDPALIDTFQPVYKKPRFTHEICIHGTYADLSLKERYRNSRIRLSGMLESIEKHLIEVGLIDRAPIYFRNSVEWQRRLRKHCFENVRRAKTVSGYDFLGPIDTHWHTFGYDCGMMNEFYELKPGETERNVLMYNSPTVLLSDLGTRSNFYGGEKLEFNLLVSHFGDCDLMDAEVRVRIVNGTRTVLRRSYTSDAENGTVTAIAHFSETMPEVSEPCALKLAVELDCGDVHAENEWELYLFPRVCEADVGDIEILEKVSLDELCESLAAGKDVLLLSGAPFRCRQTNFRMALAGRPNGNLATVIADHPLANSIPNEGFCSWQLAPMMDDGCAVVFENVDMPFDPIIEVVSGHKNAVRQAALFEYNAPGGRLLVCSLDLKKDEPASKWFKARIIEYMRSDEFAPKHTVGREQLEALCKYSTSAVAVETNMAFNVNDKTTRRKK